MQFIQNNKKIADEKSDLAKYEKTESGFVGTIWDYPEELRDNYFLMTGYRCGYKGVIGGLKTMFMWHNETVNVWTHFLGKVAALLLVAWILRTFHRPGLEGQLFQQQVDIL